MAKPTRASVSATAPATAFTPPASSGGLSIATSRSVSASVSGSAAASASA
jgi:hypothetical protein